MKKSQIQLLIGLSLVAGILLIGIQWYLMNRTFAFEVDTFEERITESVQEILEPYQTDDLLDSVFTITQQLANEYKVKERFRGQDFIDESVKRMKGQEVFGEFVRQELAKTGEQIEFEYATVLHYLGLNKEGEQWKTFLFDTIMIEQKIEGELLNLENAFPVHSITRSEDDFLIGLTMLMDVGEEEVLILGRMRTLLFLAGISILAVIGIFLYTIRTLIKQRAEAESQKDFINNITHEFKTPLATISLASKNLKNPKIKTVPAKIDQLSKLIDRQNTRLQKLIDQAMISSSISKELELSIEALPIHEFLANRIGDFKMKLDEDAVLETRFDEKEIKLEIDTFHFTTMLYNLLENGVKYSEGPAKIKVSTQVFPNEFLIQIQDEGIGMDLKKGTPIFEKFYRVPSGNVHNVKGLGLGLFYVKRIVEAHNGRVEVDSKLGKGTVFRIYFPT